MELVDWIDEIFVTEWESPAAWIFYHLQRLMFALHLLLLDYAVLN